MAKFNINQKSNVIDSVKKFMQARPAIIPNDKYEAYAIELKKTRNQLKLHKTINYVLAVIAIVSITINLTR